MKSSNPFSVLVVDAEPVARYGLVALIDSHANFKVVGEAESVRTAQVLCEKHKPLVVVIDPAIDGGQGFVFLKDLARMSPRSRSVGFSSVEEAGWVQRAFTSGAIGYVTRLDPLASVIAAIVGAVSGERVVGPRIAKALIDGMATGSVDYQRGGGPKLSEREWQIFRMVGQGKPVREMAEALGVSVKTIESHQQRIKVKMDVGSAAELRQRAALFIAKESTARDS